MRSISALGFDGVIPEEAGRPSYHPATMLKIYIYGYLNQVQSSRGLERECWRNLELIWLTGRLAPNSKTEQGFDVRCRWVIDMYVQADEPKDPAQRANWLPAPKGDFSLYARAYRPNTAVTDGSWTPPAVERAMSAEGVLRALARP